MMEIEKVNIQGGKRSLPNGWRWVKLKDVCQTTSGGTPSRAVPSYYGGDIPWVKSGDLNDGLIYETEESITQEAITNSSAKKFPAGTLLVAMYGATVGKLGILAIEAATNQAICGIFCDELLIDINYLFYYIRQQRINLIKSSFGGAQPNISQDIIRAINILLPSLDEQKRIAAILNEQMEAVEKARKNAIAQLKAAKELPAAYLRAVFNSPKAQKWDIKKLGEVADIVAGITLGNRHNKTNTRSIPYLRVANVKDGYLDLANVYQIEATKTEIEKLFLKYGDILLTEGGDPDKLGRGTFWQEEIAECIHQNHIFRVRFDFNEFCPKFISAQIGSPYGKAYFLAHAKQTTGIATINRQVLSNFPLLVPSLSEQKCIAASISEKLTEAKKLRKTLKEQLEAINNLPASLLRKAFNGEL